MPLDSGASSSCRSVGKVVSTLLLSVLALGTPAFAGKNKYNTPAVKAAEITYDQLPPIEPVFPDFGDDGGLTGAERFVS